MGSSTEAPGDYSLAFGQYNAASNNHLFTIGDGTPSAKHNALAILRDADGNVNDFNFSIKDGGNLTFGKDDSSNVFFKLTTGDNANYPLLKIESSGDTTLRNKNFYFYTSETGNDAAIAISSDTEGSSSLPRIDVTANELIVRTDKYTGDSTAAISLV